MNVKDATELHRLRVTVTSMRSRDSHNVVACGAEFARFYMGRQDGDRSMRLYLLDHMPGKV